MQELASGYGLIEGPVWDPKRGLIFSEIFSDVPNGGDHAGSLFRITAGVAGLPVPPARVTVS